MANVNLIFYSSKINREGKIPLYIRIIKDRKSKYISTGIRLLESQWDAKNERVKKSHPNSVRMNALIAKKFADAEAIALELELEDVKIKSAEAERKFKGEEDVSFIKYAESIKNSFLNKKRYGSYNKANTVINKLSKYLKGHDLLFSEMDAGFLSKYENYLRKDLKNAVNTVHSNLKLIRRIVNSAIEQQIIKPENNPFLRFKLKTEKTDKIYLTEEELKAIESVELDPKLKMFHHRQLFVFACYAGGIRISDLLQLRWKNYDGERLTFKVTKTSDTINIKLLEKAIEILEQYKNNDCKADDFIFPLLRNDIDYSDPLRLYKAISSNTAYANKNLSTIAEKAEITKHISFHTARHTFATYALRKGMRIEYVSAILGHSSIKMTQVYAKIVNEELDKAMDLLND